jgi:hypothetical protein
VTEGNRLFKKIQINHVESSGFPDIDITTDTQSQREESIENRLTQKRKNMRYLMPVLCRRGWFLWICQDFFFEKN